MDEKHSLLERIRGCKSCAERRELLRSYATRFGDFAARTLARTVNRDGGLPVIDRQVTGDGIDSTRFANMKRPEK